MSIFEIINKLIHHSWNYYKWLTNVWRNFAIFADFADFGRKKITTSLRNEAGRYTTKYINWRYGMD